MDLMLANEASLLLVLRDLSGESEILLTALLIILELLLSCVRLAGRRVGVLILL